MASKTKKPITVFKQLLKIQKELKAPKGQYNSFAKFNYRSCEDILEAVKPLLGDCVLTLTDELVETTGTETATNTETQPVIAKRFYIKATAKLSDQTSNISASALAREAFNKKGMDDSQITGTASSYARKYALNGLFAIDDAKDADTQDNRKTSGKTQTSQPATQSSAMASPAQVTLIKKMQEQGKVANDIDLTSLTLPKAKEIIAEGISKK